MLFNVLSKWATLYISMSSRAKSNSIVSFLMHSHLSHLSHITWLSRNHASVSPDCDKMWWRSYNSRAFTTQKKHVVDAFSCYNVLIFDKKHFRFVRHRTKIVQLIKVDQIQKTFRNVKRVWKRNIDSLNVDSACHSYCVLFDDRRWLVEIIHTNEFWEKSVQNKNRLISYIVLKTNRV
jgi:hypothetical protein